MSNRSKAVRAAIVLAGLIVTTGSWAENPPGTTVASTDAVAPAEPSVTVLGSKQAQSVLGKEVRSTADENLGRIVDIVVDQAGQVRAAVIDFGGFLGVGSRQIAVDWNALRFSPDDIITLELTREQVKGAPEYKDRRAVVVVGAAGALRSLPYDF